MKVSVFCSLLLRVNGLKTCAMCIYTSILNGCVAASIGHWCSFKLRYLLILSRYTISEFTGRFVWFHTSWSLVNSTRRCLGRKRVSSWFCCVLPPVVCCLSENNTPRFIKTCPCALPLSLHTRNQVNIIFWNTKRSKTFQAFQRNCKYAKTLGELLQSIFFHGNSYPLYL